MKPVAAELVFLGHCFLKADAAELGALAKELQLPRWERAVADDATQLELEYNRLFFNPLGTPCPLWQSANLEEPHLMAEPHLSALQWFRHFGVEPAATNEPADHAGLLLLFCAHLLDAGAEAEAVEQFRSEHLDWIPRFCETVQRATRLTFYRAACERLQQILDHELRVALPANGRP